MLGYGRPGVFCFAITPGIVFATSSSYSFVPGLIVQRKEKCLCAEEELTCSFIADWQPIVKLVPIDFVRTWVCP
jgi:hypothetical protein